MKFFKKEELKTLWPFYLDALISPLLYFAPAFFIIYFMNLNFTFFQIGILLSAAPLTAFLFEIPTGAIADLYGRKLSVLTGYFLEAIIALLLFFFTNYYAILILFALWGIASTLSSGSHQAWVVDYINKKDKKLLHSYFNKTQVFDSFALILSGLIGALLVKIFGVAIIWPATFLSFISAAIILSSAKEYHIKEETNIKKAFKGLFRQTKKTVSYGYKHPVLFYFLLATFLFVLAEGSTHVAWIPFMQGLGFPDYAFGYLWSLIAFVIMIAPIVSLNSSESTSILNSVLVLPAVNCLCFASACFFLPNPEAREDTNWSVAFPFFKSFTDISV